MRVLLDECIPQKLRIYLSGHDVRSVAEMGWAGIKNGRLLRLAEQNFDAFLTVDRNLEFQQNLGALSLAVIVLIAPSNEVDTLRSLMPQVSEALGQLRAGHIIHISA